MKEPNEILTDNAETYREKDADYGSSWREAGRILHRLADGEEVVLETPEDFISFGLFTRRLDKFARAFHGEFLGNNLSFESIEDSHADESCYAAIHASLLAEQEIAEGAKKLLEASSAYNKKSETDGGVTTEKEYNKTLPIDSEYQAKYEELAGES